MTLRCLLGLHRYEILRFSKDAMWLECADCMRPSPGWDIAARPLRRVCAWCRGVISDGRLPTSHGLCPTCEVSVRRAEGLELVGG